MKMTDDTLTADALADLEAVLRQVDRGGVKDPELLSGLRSVARDPRARAGGARRARRASISSVKPATKERCALKMHFSLGTRIPPRPEWAE